MNIETLNNIIGNTLNRVIAKAIDSIGALPVGGKYIFAASNPFTILVQRDAFADYPTVIFQDVKTGKDFFALKDVSKKSREDLQNAIMNHVQKTGVNSDNLQFLSFNEFLKKSFDRNRIYRTNPIRIKIFDVLKKLDKKEMTVLLKNRVFDTWIKDNLNPIIKDIKDYLLIGKVENAIQEALFNFYKKNKSEGSKLQTKKENELKIKIKKFVSIIIEELRAEKRDKKATPKKKTTSKKQTIKKTVKAKPKKVSSSIETCSDAGRILRIKKSSAAGRKLAVCRWN